MSNNTRTAYANPRTAYAFDAPPDADDNGARLNWLVAFHAHDDKRRRLFRNAREEREMLLMRRPVPTARAYSLFGMLLGLVPPAVIFYRMCGYPLMQKPSVGTSERLTFFLFCFAMNAICCIVGRLMGAKLGKWIDDLERASWTKMILVSLLVGLLWAIVTGATGGLIVFIIGAFFGIFCAAPVGALGFLSFTSLHRLVARGGMIDARHLWPLACGVTFIIAALILGLH
ncbi:MAG TPA: hypothetical protein VNA19_15420 [Pyrinomonadaceae bacterium]|jgi:hypothetical protein|nr:hypothetical protein [Pyrinomonadaceae bacterium]